MRSPIARLYAVSATLVVFFFSWAVLAARPLASSGRSNDPRLAALAVRERRLQAESVAVRRILERRWGAYRAALARRRRAIAAAQRRISHLAVTRAPAVEARAAASTPAPAVIPPPAAVITSAPVTATRTS
jgi:hypothetical protein